jgi:hypothetical protein
MKAPSRDLGELHIAYGAEATLQIPEEAKCSSTPKRCRHMIPFAFLEVGLVGWIVRVGFAFDFYVSFNGCAICEPQPHCLWAALVIVRFPEEAPVIKSLPPKILLFEPAAGFFWMPSSGPLPQAAENGGVHALKNAFTHHMPVLIGPAPYFGV